MTKQEFLRCAIISITVTVIVSAMVIAFFAIFTAYKYPLPNENNTYYKSGTVEKVYYYGGKNTELGLELTDGSSLLFVYPFSSKQFFSQVGYDFEGLSTLLEGNTIEYRALNNCPWLLEVCVGEIVIDNTELTEKQIVFTWIGSIILAILVMVIIVGVEISYLHPKYKLYQKKERERLKRVMREIQRRQRRNGAK